MTEDMVYCPECGSIPHDADSGCSSLSALYVCFNCKDEGYFFTEADIEMKEERDEPLECAYCSKEFNTRSARRNHVTEHEEEIAKKEHDAEADQNAASESAVSKDYKDVLEEKYT